MNKNLSFFLLEIIAFLALCLFGQILLIHAQPQKDNLQEVTDRLLQNISQTLQLPIKYKVKIDFKDRAELEKYLIKRLHEDYPKNKLKAIKRAYAKIGLLPREIDLEKLLLRIYKEQVAGFYDQKTKKLCLIKGFDPVLQQAIMVHELTHALQDQHFNLDFLVNININNDDLLLARQAVIEGQATALMMENLLGQNIAQLPDIGPMVNMSLNMPLLAESSLTKAPEYISKHLLFPYGAGTSFIRRYFSVHQSYNAIQLFSHMPTSSEQIIHFEKYNDDLDVPTSIKINGLENSLYPTWFPLYSDVIGELDLSILLKAFMSEEKANNAAQGWDGSRFYTFKRRADENVLLIWLSNFDSKADALEFFQCYRQIITAKYDKKKLMQKKAKQFYQWETEENLAYLELRGSDVLIIEGIESKYLSKLKNLCFGAIKKPY